MTRLCITTVFTLLLSLAVYAQVPDIPDHSVSKRVIPAPENVFKMFREAGMDPSNHELTAIEMEKVKGALAQLPPLHKKIIKAHLHSISFMDNMPNTALTSPVERQDSVKLFNITFRAAILHETISEWATKKENTLYDRSNDPEFEVSVEAGKLDALLYVLLHEVTHVVDAVLEITPHPDDADAFVAPTALTKEVWYKMNKPVGKFIDSLVEKTLFRGGGRVSITSAPEIYRKLARMPFVSLYATASWFEDVAELETIYHLTNKMNQPFRVVVRKNSAELIKFEPMKGKLVRRRLHHLERFYREDLRGDFPGQ